MFRTQLPRLYELPDLIADRISPNAYFPADFETRLHGEPSPLSLFVCWEKKFQFLDEGAWKALKNEAAPYLTRRDPRRGWHQLFDIRPGRRVWTAEEHWVLDSLLHSSVDHEDARSRGYPRFQTDFVRSKDNQHLGF